MAKVLFTCFHPQSLCDVALLRRSLCGGGKRGKKDGGGPPGRTRSGDGRRERSPAGLSPDGCGGRRFPGHRWGLWCGRCGGGRLHGSDSDSEGRRGSGGAFSSGVVSYSCGGELDGGCCGVLSGGQR